MRRYVFNVVIEEGNDEFWESLAGSGCEVITDLVKDAIDDVFDGNAHTELMHFTQTKEFQNRL